LLQDYINFQNESLTAHKVWEIKKLDGLPGHMVFHSTLDYQLLGAFAKQMQEATISFTTTHPHGTTQLQLQGFS
jgi:hypothetical protein